VRNTAYTGGVELGFMTARCCRRQLTVTPRGSRGAEAAKRPIITLARKPSPRCPRIRYVIMLQEIAAGLQEICRHSHIPLGT